MRSAWFLAALRPARVVATALFLVVSLRCGYDELINLVAWRSRFFGDYGAFLIGGPSTLDLVVRLLQHNFGFGVLILAAAIEIFPGFLLPSVQAG